MRDINRIDKVLSDLGKIWKQVPDWRFLQLITNFQSAYGSDGFYLEDDSFIELLNKYMEFLKGQ